MYMLTIVAVIGSTLTFSSVIDQPLTLSGCNSAVTQLAAQEGGAVKTQNGAKYVVIPAGNGGVFATCAKIAN